MKTNDSAPIESCGGCRFWLEVPLSVPLGKGKGGQCRLQPGDALVNPMNGTIACVLPPKLNTDWCGQFQPVRPTIAQTSHKPATLDSGGRHG